MKVSGPGLNPVRLGLRSRSSGGSVVQDRTAAGNGAACQESSLSTQKDLEKGELHRIIDFTKHMPCH